MSKITYEDKVGIEPKTVAINQVQDVDMNEIKEVVNYNADSGNVNDATDFTKATGVYVNAPNSPWISPTIPLILTDAINGGITSIWYKGSVLTKANFTGGVVTMFSGVNILDELCRIFIDYDRENGCFGINIQTGFTGDLPPTNAPAQMTINSVTDWDLTRPATMTINSII